MQGARSVVQISDGQRGRSAFSGRNPPSCWYRRTRGATKNRWRKLRGQQWWVVACPLAHGAQRLSTALIQRPARELL